MKTITLLIKKSTIWMNIIAEVILVLMMMITVVDVVLRTSAHRPGDIKMVAMMGAMVSDSLLQKRPGRGHVFVDFLIENRSVSLKNAFFISTEYLAS